MLVPFESLAIPPKRHESYFRRRVPCGREQHEQKQESQQQVPDASKVEDAAVEFANKRDA